MKLYKFTADWCGPCQSMARSGTMEKFSEKYPEVEVIEVDVDEPENADLITTYEIRSIPTLVLESGEKSKAHIGGATLAALEKLYNDFQKE